MLDERAVERSISQSAGRPPNWLSSSYDGPALTMRGGPQTGESTMMMDQWGGCRGNRQTDRPARRWINAASAGVTADWLSSSYDGPALTMRGGPQTGESTMMMDQWGGCRGNRQTDRPARRWINAASAGVTADWLSSSYDGPALTMRGGPQTGESATMMDPWGGCRGNRQTDRPARRWINAAHAGNRPSEGQQTDVGRWDCTQQDGCLRLHLSGRARRTRGAVIWCPEEIRSPWDASDNGPSFLAMSVGPSDDEAKVEHAIWSRIAIKVMKNHNINW